MGLGCLGFGFGGRQGLGCRALLVFFGCKELQKMKTKMEKNMGKDMKAGLILYWVLSRLCNVGKPYQLPIPL